MRADEQRNNIERSESSSSSSSGNIWEIEGITINFNEITINDVEFNTELRRIKTNGTGGLGIEQTAGALKMRLKDREDVYVVYNKEICGVAEFDNIRIANQINRLVLVQKYVVFPYAINEGHQVSVVINMEEKQLIVTDSLGMSRKNNNNLKVLARNLGIERIIDGASNYNRQRNNWECGVHTFFNTLDAVNNRRINTKVDLELNENIKVVLEYSTRYRWIEEKLQAKREKNRLEKTKLLEAIESLRDIEGNFKNSNPEDDLKILADALQIETWGNLDRREPTSHSGRNLTQEERIRERKIEELIEQYEREHPKDVLGIIILNVLKRGGQYNEVINYYRSVLSNKSMGFAHIEHEDNEASKSNNMGYVFYNLGKFDKSLECFVNALTLLKNKVDNREYIFFGILYNNIGSVLYSQGKHEEALVNFKKALKIWRTVLGINHHKVATSYNNIGGVLNDQGKYEEALISHRKALAVREEVLGPDHPDIASSYNNIGFALDAQGKYEEALISHRKALAIREEVLGPDHPDTASSYNNIATVLFKQGEYEEALVNYRKAFKIGEKVLGPDHPGVATSYNNIGIILHTKKIYEEALANYRKALKIRKKILGPDHPHIATSYNNIAAVLDAQGKYEEALVHFSKSLIIMEKVLGPDHPNVASTYNNIGSVLYAQDKYEEALVHFRKALAIWQKVLGSDHPDIATSYNNIAIVLYSQDKYEEALFNFKKALEIKEKILGADHPVVIAINKNINLVLRTLDRSREVPADSDRNRRQQQTTTNNCIVSDEKITEEEEVEVVTNSFNKVSMTSTTHKELMRKLAQELRVDYSKVYIGIAVEQALVGMAGISTIQTDAQYRPSTTNGVITTKFKLKFTSTEELNKFVDYYNQRFPELIVSEELRFQAGGFTEVNMDTRVLYNYVAKSLGEYVAQATSTRITSFRNEQSGCYLS